MFKRVTWMGMGAVAGAAGTLWTQRKVRSQVDRLAPPALVDAAKARVIDVRDVVAAAVDEGRAAMRETEDRMRADRQRGPRPR